MGGRFPATLCQLHSLRTIHFNDNHIFGDLPECLTTLLQLRDIVRPCPPSSLASPLLDFKSAPHHTPDSL